MNTNPDTLAELTNDCDHAYAKHWDEDIARVVCNDCLTPIEYTLDEFVIEMQEIKDDIDLTVYMENN